MEFINNTNTNTNSNANTNLKSDTETCSICLNNFNSTTENYCTTSCNHCFHFSCIAKHIGTNKTQCPLCRNTLFEDNINDNNTSTNDSSTNDTSIEDESSDEEELLEGEEERIKILFKKIYNHLAMDGISYKQLVLDLCYLEHEEFQDASNALENSDYIFGKIRQVINRYNPNSSRVAAINAIFENEANEENEDQEYST